MRGGHWGSLGVFGLEMGGKSRIRHDPPPPPPLMLEEEEAVLPETGSDL